MTTNLTLARIDGDCGNFISGNTFDLLEVRYGESIMATVKLSYECDDREFTITCSKIDHANAPKVFSEVHLIACVTATMMRAFTADHEFYCDVFFNEAGERIELPLFDPISA